MKRAQVSAAISNTVTPPPSNTTATTPSDAAPPVDDPYDDGSSPNSLDHIMERNMFKIIVLIIAIFLVAYFALSAPPSGTHSFNLAWVDSKAPTELTTSTIIIYIVVAALVSIVLWEVGHSMFRYMNWDRDEETRERHPHFAFLESMKSR